MSVIEIIFWWCVGGLLFSAGWALCGVLINFRREEEARKLDERERNREAAELLIASRSWLDMAKQARREGAHERAKASLATAERIRAQAEVLLRKNYTDGEYPGDDPVSKA